jgi:hypothetical protein
MSYGKATSMRRRLGRTKAERGLSFAPIAIKLDPAPACRMTQRGPLN